MDYDELLLQVRIVETILNIEVNLSITIGQRWWLTRPFSNVCA
jgi:hypothetical protein